MIATETGPLKRARCTKPKTSFSFRRFVGIVTISRDADNACAALQRQTSSGRVRDASEEACAR